MRILARLSALSLALVPQQPLGVQVLPAEAHRAAVHVGPVLADEALRDAVGSGLPVRMHLRVELWRDEWIDNLQASTEFDVLLTHDPLARSFLLRIHSSRPLSVQTLGSYAETRAVAEAVYRPQIAPRRSGRYYYTAALRIETLSLSDLEELERWLKGELGPAVSGRRSVPGALESGLRRGLIRLLGLPTRAYEARSPYFRVP